MCCPNNYDCNEDQLSCEFRDSFRGRNLLLTTTDYNQCGSSSTYCSSDQTCCDTYGTSDQAFACCSSANVCLDLFSFVESELVFSSRLSVVLMVRIVVHRDNRVMFKGVDVCREIRFICSSNEKREKRMVLDKSSSEIKIKKRVLVFKLLLD